MIYPLVNENPPLPTLGDRSPQEPLESPVSYEKILTLLLLFIQGKIKTPWS